MKQKRHFFVLAAFFILTFFAPSMPALANTNVSDWIEQKGPEAEQPAQTVELEPVEEQSLLAIVAKLIFYTLLILVLIYGLIKFLAIRQRKLQPNQAVKLLGGTPLGNNKSLQLIKVGEKIYMIGVGNEVTLIKEFTETEEIGSIEKDLENQPTIFSNKNYNWSEGLFGKKNVKEKSDKSFENLFQKSLLKQQKQQNLEQKLTDSDKEGNVK